MISKETKISAHEMNRDILSRIGSEISAAMERWVLGGQSENYWREPITAAASALDPLFGRLKEAVDPEHAMPGDLLNGARTVIVFFLPFQRWIGIENDQAERFSAQSWAESYVAANRLIQAINGHLKEVIERWGHQAVITPPTHNFDEVKLVSGWSHKHIAYIAGLGTFGHHHLLITSAGCCGRLGSLVTTMPIPSTPRVGQEKCLVKAGKRCHVCVAKCQYGALSRTHFDRHSCYRQCLVNDARFSSLPLTDVCGKCACEVPCSHEIPDTVEI